MSDTYNDVWLEAAKEHFEQALKDEDFVMCRAVIQDLKENGFSKQAIVLEAILTEMQH